jgi:hypothetical protein
MLTWLEPSSFYLRLAAIDEACARYFCLHFVLHLIGRAAGCQDRFFRQARDVRSLITVRGHRLGVRLCVSLGSLFLVAKISGPCHVQRRWPCPSPPELLAALYLSPQSLSSLSLPWKCYGDSVRQGGHRPGGRPSRWQWLSRRSWDAL